MKAQNNTANERVLLTDETLLFRTQNPETVQQWEVQLGMGEAEPDLHFCYHALEKFENLCALADSMEYRIGLAINAHILHSFMQRQFLESGLQGPMAVEQSNHEILLLYRALDEQKLSDRASILKFLQANS